MLKNFRLLLQLINDYLWHSEEDDDIIVIPEEKLLDMGLKLDDIRLCFKTLVQKGVIKDYDYQKRFRYEIPTTRKEKEKLLKKNWAFWGRILFLGEERERFLRFLIGIDRKKIHELLEEINNKPEDKTLMASQIAKDIDNIQHDKSNEETVRFADGIVFFGRNCYRPNDELKQSLLSMLWENRQEIIVGAKKKFSKLPGRELEKYELAHNLKRSQTEISEAIKYINRRFREKGWSKFTKISTKRGKIIWIIGQNDKKKA